MKRSGYSLTISIILMSCGSRVMPTVAENNRLVISQGDTVYTFHILNSDAKKIRTENNSLYYYYSHGAIKGVQGDYNGKLLDGYFTLENRNHSLLEKGEFKKGRKTGQWNQWHDNGFLKKTVKWRDGLAQGKFYEYTPSGKLLKKGTYKNGVLHGSVVTISGNEKEKVRYSRGEIIVRKSKAAAAEPNPQKIKKEKKPKKDSTEKKQKDNNKDVDNVSGQEKDTTDKNTKKKDKRTSKKEQEEPKNTQQ